MSSSCECRYTRLKCKSCKNTFRWTWLKCRDYPRHLILPGKQLVPDSRVSKEDQPLYCENCEVERSRAREREGRASAQSRLLLGKQQLHPIGARPGYYTSYSLETVRISSPRDSRETIDTPSEFGRESRTGGIEFAELGQSEQANRSSNFRRDSDAGQRRDQTRAAEASKLSGYQDRHRRHGSERREEPLSRNRAVHDNGGVPAVERESGRPPEAVGDAVIAAPAHRQRSAPPASSGTQGHPVASYGTPPPDGSGQAVAGGSAGPSRGSAMVNANEVNEESGDGDAESVQHAGEATEEAGPASTRPGEYIEVVEDSDQESRDVNSLDVNEDLEEEDHSISSGSSAQRRPHIPARRPPSGQEQPADSSSDSNSRRRQLAGAFATPSSSSSARSLGREVGGFAPRAPSPPTVSGAPRLRRIDGRAENQVPSSSARPGSSWAAMASGARNSRDRRGHGILVAPGPSSQARPSSSRTAAAAEPDNILGQRDNEGMAGQVEGVPDTPASLPPTISSDSNQPQDERRRSGPQSEGRPPPTTPAIRSREPNRERQASARPALQTPNPFGPLASRSPSIASQRAESSGPSRPPERRRSIGEEAQVRPNLNLPSSSSSKRRNEPRDQR